MPTAFRPALTARGQRVGIIALGGGFHQRDMQDYLAPGQTLEVVTLDDQIPAACEPEVVQVVWKLLQDAWAGRTGTVPSGGPKIDKQALNRFKWTLEVTADIQNLARFAPGAELVVYFTPPTMQGKYTAFTSALVDERAPQVLSCSWGTHENWVSPRHAWVMDDVLSLAVLRGVTICFSSGDDGDGSRPLNVTQKKHEISAHFPASSPHVLACGGTMPNDFAEPKDEVVWNEDIGLVQMASGGGVSRTFGSPWWQSKDMIAKQAHGRTGRGIPDVAGKADVETGYKVTVAGVDMPIGGTSSVAPLWAALIACVNQKLGTPAGFVTPLLYLHREQFAAATTPVKRGDNGDYRAGDGWDACTGWGTPNGNALLKALGGTDH